MTTTTLKTEDYTVPLFNIATLLLYDIGGESLLGQSSPLQVDLKSLLLVRSKWAEEIQRRWKRWFQSDAVAVSQGIRTFRTLPEMNRTELAVSLSHRVRQELDFYRGRYPKFIAAGLAIPTEQQVIEKWVGLAHRIGGDEVADRLRVLLGVRVQRESRKAGDLEKLFKSVHARLIMSTVDRENHCFDLYKRAIEAAARDIFKNFSTPDGKNFFISRDSGSLTIDWNLTDQRALDWLTNYTFAFRDRETMGQEVSVQRTVYQAVASGKSIPQLMDDIKQHYSDLIDYKAERIARTESVRASAQGALFAYEEMGYATATRREIKDDRTNKQLCLPYDGDTYSIANAKIGSRDGYPGVLPAHVNCVTDPRVPVYTTNGWKPIGSIVVGERVLTHRGRYCPVTQVHRNSSRNVEVVTIRIVEHGPRGNLGVLQITGDHPLLSNGQWVRARDIQVGDRVTTMSTICKGCGKTIPLIRKSRAQLYCSASCQWLDDGCATRTKEGIRQSMLQQYASGARDRMRITQAANQRTRELVLDGNFVLQKLDRSGDNSPCKRPAVRAKLSQMRMGDRNPMHRSKHDDAYWEAVRARQRQYYADNPDKHVNAVLARKRWSGGMTYIEQRMGEALIRQGVVAEFNYRVGSWWIDWALPGYKIGIECDGAKWHSTLEQIQHDQERDARLSELGWTMLRFSGREINTQVDACVDSVQRLMSNHDDCYVFGDAIVTSVSIQHIRTKLYNLSVAGDESYCAKSFVVHNCRGWWQVEGLPTKKPPAGTAQPQPSPGVPPPSVVPKPVEPPKLKMTTDERRKASVDDAVEDYKVVAKEVRDDLLKHDLAQRAHLNGTRDNLTRTMQDWNDYFTSYSGNATTWVRGSENATAPILSRQRNSYAWLGALENGITESERAELLSIVSKGNPAPATQLFGETGYTGQKTVAKGFRSRLVAAQSMLRGVVNADRLTVQESVTVKVLPARSRACARGSRFVGLPSTSLGHTAAHELGHTIEMGNTHVQTRAAQFRKFMQTDTTARWLGGNYDLNERATPTKLVHPYASKYYPGDPATEIISTGVEMLYTDPVWFAKNHFNYFTFILGVLRGEI